MICGLILMKTLKTHAYQIFSNMAPSFIWVSSYPEYIQMAISRWQVSVFLFFYLSIVLGYPWDGQPVVAFLFLKLFPDDFCMTHLGTQTQETTLSHPLKPLKPNKYPLKQCLWLAYHASFHFRKPSTSGGRKPSRQWRWPPGTSLQRNRRTERPFPIMGSREAQHNRALRRLSMDGHYVLEDSGKLLPLTEKKWYTVMYSYLFKQFHLIFYYNTSQIFVLNWPSLQFSLILLFFTCRPWGSWWRQCSWKGMQHAWSIRDSRSWSWPWWVPLWVS